MECCPLESHVGTDLIQPAEKSDSHQFIDFCLPLEIILLQSVSEFLC